MICVRKYDDSDIPTIMAIERQSFTTPWGHRDFKDCLRRKQIRCIVAEDMSDEIPTEPVMGFPGLNSPVRRHPVIGFSIVEIQAERVWIVSIAVEIASRRCGVGSAMLDFLLSKMVDKQAAYAMIGEKDVAAAMFFVGNDFQVVGCCDDWFGNPETCQSAYMLERVKGGVVV